jgi:hypothetical protein
LAAGKLNESKLVSEDLVLELAAHPGLLDLALSRVKNADWIRCLLLTSSEDQLRAADLTGNFWLRFRYLLCLESFNAAEFSEMIPYSLQVIKFFPFMGLNRPCHFEAFVYLISHEAADFSEPENWQDNMLFQIFAQSNVSEYWYLFPIHARNLPPIRMDGDYITKSVHITANMLEPLASRLSLLEYFAFDSYESWQLLTAHFHALDISVPIAVNYTELLQNTRFAFFMPPQLNAEIQWPLLHLCVILDNLPAFRAVLSHPRFRPESIQDTVAGMSLEHLFDRCDEAEMNICQCSIDFSVSFRTSLAEFIHK